MRIKKIVMLLTAGTFVLGATACGTSTQKDSSASDVNEAAVSDVTESASSDVGENAQPQEVAQPAYTLDSVHEVNGRQGVAAEGDYYWVSGSASLTKYDRDFNVVAENTEPFKDFDLEVNHIGDIDVYNNELYLGVENFVDGVGSNIQVAVFDADTLELKRVFPFSDKTGQLECSGIAVDPDNKIVYMCSWIDNNSSSFLYMYSLEDESYLGKVHMTPYPQWLQGIAYYDGNLYATCDDGDADEELPDHMYKVEVSKDRKSASVTLEKTFDDVTRQGEIEGLTFDKESGNLLLLYNRGARIVLGMPSGFYDGYDEEIHEVMVYMCGSDLETCDHDS